MDDAATADALELGCFSLSLPGADIDASLAFYATLGFTEIGGEGQWRIIGNGPTKIGLFEEHLDQPILTFNPGLPQEFEPSTEGLPAPLEDFTDVREIERRLIDAGLTLEKGTETEGGPDHILLKDPDGNLLMFDQFF